MAGNTFKRMEKKITLPTAVLPDLQARVEMYMKPDPFNVDNQP